jgi:hypothetical protein
MAKGSPTADENANFGVGAAPVKATGPKIMPGASLTKAPTGNAEGAGWWAPNDKLPAGVTAQWVPPPVAPVTVPTAAPLTPRDRFASMMRGDNWANGGSRSRSSDAGYTTSGRGWSGNSSANSGYGMGGRDW